MLKDCLEIFKKCRDTYLAQNPSNTKISFITDNYKLQAGSYILVDSKDGSIKKYLEVNKNTERNEDYDKFAVLDYLSMYLGTNKSVESKNKIHSNNIYSFFVKKDSLMEQTDEKKKLKEEMIDAYYKNLSDPESKYRKSKDKKDIEKLKIYLNVEKKYGKVNYEEVEYAKNWVKKKIWKKELFQEIDNLNTEKNYIKIFFDFLKDKYVEETEKYIIPNIYNDTKYNIVINNKIYGVPDNNMTLNDKKPFFENKSRKTKQPYLIDENEVLEQKYFFDYLMNFSKQGKFNIYCFEDKIKGFNDNDEIPNQIKNNFYFRVGIHSRPVKTETKILDFDVIRKEKSKLQITNNNMLGPYYEEKLKYLGDLSGRLATIIDDIFYEKNLNKNYFQNQEKVSISTTSLITVSLIVETKSMWENLFFKNNDTLFKRNFEKNMMKIIKNTLINEKDKKYLKGAEQFNLYLSILDYLEGGKRKMEKKINNFYDVLSEKINNKNTQAIESDEEYFFAIGQTIRYLLSLGKGGNLTHSLIRPFLNATNNEKLSSELVKLFNKYSHAVDINNKRFNNLYAMILEYNYSGKINERLLIAGYLHSLVIYFKEGDEE